MRLFILPLALLLSACSLTPTLLKPELRLPSSLKTGLGESKQIPAAVPGLQQMFGDQRLQSLIALALANNHDLQLALLNVQAVRAQYGIQRAARFPALDLSASETRQRPAADPAQLSTATAVQQQYSVNAALSSFEIDLFGRLRSLSDAALARYLASEQGRRASQIALIAAVAEAYFAERLAQQQLSLASSTLHDWRLSLDLARRLRAAHQSSGLDIAQAEGQVATAAAELEARSRALAQARNALQLLIGKELPAGLPPGLPLDRQPVQALLPAGLSSELLLRRPDILQAEQNLLAANAEIGAARAAFFPRLSMTTSLGYASAEMNNLFSGSQRIWSFSPQLALPIFQGGRLDAELRLAEVRKSAALVEYEKVIQTAFREVADGLAGQATYGRQISAQIQALASAERRLELSDLRYRAGLDGRLELLDAQRQLYSARQILLDLRRDELGNAIALYKALGGGLPDSAGRSESLH